MKLKNALVLALAMGCTTAAYAADDMESANWYVGVGASSFDFERSGAGSHSYNTHGYVLKVGYDLGDYLSVEGRMGTGDQSSGDGAGLKLEGRTLSAAYVRLNLPFKKAKFYVMGGYASVNVKGELPGTSHTTDLKGTSYGVGVELYGNATTALSAEYMRYVNKQKVTDAALGLDNEFDVNGLSFNLVHHF